MESNRENELFVCNHISQDDLEDLLKFEPANNEAGFLAEYAQKCAYLDETQQLARTYIIRDKYTNEVAMYFSLKAGFIAYNERRWLFKKKFDSAPGVEMSNFAASGAYRASHPEYKGYGNVVFDDFVLPYVRDAAKIIGARFLYIFALPHKKLIETYESYGFVRLSKYHERKMHARIKPRYDQGCVFMYLSLV